MRTPHFKKGERLCFVFGDTIWGGEIIHVDQRPVIDWLEYRLFVDTPYTPLDQPWPVDESLAIYREGDQRFAALEEIWREAAKTGDKGLMWDKAHEVALAVFAARRAESEVAGEPW